MLFRKIRFVVILIVGLFTIQESPGSPLSKEPVKTEIVVKTYQGYEQPMAASSPTRNHVKDTALHSFTLKKFGRNVFLTFLIILALCGIPVAPPNKLEMDKEDRLKTEIMEGSEESEKT
jgi:hypothetical protein